ncbi:unnamed protein product, partial [Discosporangium mesarthrocarpum]
MVGVQPQESTLLTEGETPTSKQLSPVDQGGGQLMSAEEREADRGKESPVVQLSGGGHAPSSSSFSLPALTLAPGSPPPGPPLPSLRLYSPPSPTPPSALGGRADHACISDNKSARGGGDGGGSSGGAGGEKKSKNTEDCKNDIGDDKSDDDGKKKRNEIICPSALSLASPLVPPGPPSPELSPRVAGVLSPGRDEGGMLGVCLPRVGSNDGSQ